MSSLAETRGTPLTSALEVKSIMPLASSAFGDDYRKRFRCRRADFVPKIVTVPDSRTHATPGRFEIKSDLDIADAGVVAMFLELGNVKINQLDVAFIGDPGLQRI